MITLDKKITSYRVKPQVGVILPVTPTLETLHEGIKRPEVLNGCTVKIKNPVGEHAVYLTINFFTLNAGTEYETKVPYELFINSKNMEHFQWIVALTLSISAVWRKGGESQFLIEELKSTFDPKGGYFKKGGIWMNSMVAEIGHAIENVLYPKLQVELPAKVKEAVNNGVKMQTCPSCQQKAMILMDGCMTCTACGHSKCG